VRVEQVAEDARVGLRGPIWPEITSPSKRSRNGKRARVRAKVSAFQFESA
jgi:hypothetical protein